MNRKVKKIFQSWRVLLLLFFLILSIVAIGPAPGREGVAIRAVEVDSAASIAGIAGSKSTDRPISREVITSVNGVEIINEDDYYAQTSNLVIGEVVTIVTNKGVYTPEVLPNLRYYESENETINVTKEVFNDTLNKTVNVTIVEPKMLSEVLGPQDLGLTIYNAPNSNVKKGLDLQGGTRVLLKPINTSITSQDYDFIKSNLEQRLNVFGLSDLDVTVVKNFQLQPEYIMVEIAGSTVGEIESLVLSQGRFEGQIGNITVFSGDNKDILFVGRGPSQSRIESCNTDPSGIEVCTFSFQMKLSETAANRQAKITKELEVVVSDSGSKYLAQELELYLDGSLKNSLKISESLKGQAVTDISISGSATGATRNDAIENATSEMKQLQSIIATGSLPSKLEIVKTDTISPVLGSGFVSNAINVGLLALLAVGIILFIRYRNFSLVIPMVIALFLEVVMILGFTAFIGRILDLSAIAGILLTVGTGVDHLVIISDEILYGKKSFEYEGFKNKIKKAFTIILIAFLTTVFAMVPLWFAGAGLLRGFAITTIIGLMFGVFIVRPAFAKITEILTA